MKMIIRLLIATLVIVAAGALSIGTQVKLAAQRKEGPRPCPPFCAVSKQDVAFIQHRIAGHDHD